MNKLQQHINVSEELRHRLNQIVTKCKIKALIELLAPAQEQKELIFLVSGIIRNYYKEDLREWTSRFSEAGDFVLSIDNFLFNLPCNEFIETCAKAEIIRFSKKDYTNLFLDFPELNIVAKDIAGKRLKENNDRMYSCRMLSAAKRYHQFVNQNPILSRQIQIQHIASYLDISPYNLSRIRREFNK
ncbi:Crp/Fnr family transcriptional regulator [Dyadobacter sp. CY312]|uniref:Crp/Fnr family transcriptional regulator n=1 Tax=Dyadobacter sp. CY312 TaxID=2907303 RepID=UPI001F34A6B4|nr:Crp/Fnr family transcriptional regulator [Dyadobacter sp. CY312]MCE7043642.1 Crp/Fnr family transcriptional regulator [Dyadobacter sp. CY312]